MKTIGFIDYYIDEWHAHNYPQMIRQSALGGEFQVKFAWAQVDPPGKMPLAEWCRSNEVRQAESLEQVVDACDGIVVLSPDNAEKHEELADLPLRSGKPVYIDKPIAPTLAAAQRLFDKATAHGTPLMSCSALRFAPEVLAGATASSPRIPLAAIRGGGSFDVYAIHQVEMLVMLLGTGATRVLRQNKSGLDVLLVDYDDDRRGMITLMHGHGFEFSARLGEETISSGPLTSFFPRFIDGMLEFFRSGRSLVPPEQTLEIAAIVEAGSAAADGENWRPVPRR